MKKAAAVVLLIVMLAIWAAPAAAATDGIKTVSPEEFASKVSGLLSGVGDLLGVIVTPLAMICLAVCAIMIMVGSLFAARAVTRLGLMGFMFTVLGLVVYYCIPMLIGLIKGVSQGA